MVSFRVACREASSSSSVRDSSPDPPSVLAPSSRTPRSADDLLGPLRGVLSDLMRSAELGSGDVSQAIPHLTEVSAQLLDVDRASVWLFRSGHSELACADLYERRFERHSTGLVLSGEAYPRYFKALAEERSIPASDATRDPRTSERCV